MHDLTGQMMPPNQREIVERFARACQSDPRVAAAFLGGSHASGAADAHSDIDLYVITTDAGFEAFLAAREEFVSRLGELAWSESFQEPNMILFIFADGTEGELGIGFESRFTDIHKGPYVTLLDKMGILNGVAFAGVAANPAEQKELLRSQLSWFWHDLSHFITALSRGDLWWAAGQIEVLRGICVTLARLEQNFMDGEAGEEPYFKVGQALPSARLEPLRATYCPVQFGPLLDASFVLLAFYKALAVPLAEKHGFVYASGLESVYRTRLERLRRSL